MTWLWVLLGLVAWTVAAAVAGVLLGRGIEAAYADEEAELLDDWDVW